MPATSDYRYELLTGMGYAGANADAAISAWLRTQGLTGGGVAPVGFVEPFNDWQRQGLTTLAQGFNQAEPLFQMGANLAGYAVPGYVAAAGAPVTAAEHTAAIADYMNPYLDAVIGRTTAGLDTAGADARNRLMASQGYRKAFGDTSLGVQGAELDKTLINSRADATANLSYAGFNDAANRAYTTLSDNRTRALNAAGAGTTAANTAANFGTTYEDRARRNALGQLQAGTAVQGQNQRTLDVLRDQITGATNFDQARLAQLAQYLNAVPGSTYQNFATTEPNAARRIGNALTVAGGIDWSTIFGGGNA